MNNPIILLFGKETASAGDYEKEFRVDYGQVWELLYVSIENETKGWLLHKIVCADESKNQYVLVEDFNVRIGSKSNSVVWKGQHILIGGNYLILKIHGCDNGDSISYRIIYRRVI